MSEGAALLCDYLSFKTSLSKVNNSPKHGEIFRCHWNWGREGERGDICRKPLRYLFLREASRRLPEFKQASKNIQTLEKA